MMKAIMLIIGLLFAFTNMSSVRAEQQIVSPVFNISIPAEINATIAADEEELAEFDVTANHMADNARVDVSVKTLNGKSALVSEENQQLEFAFNGSETGKEGSWFIGELSPVLTSETVSMIRTNNELVPAGNYTNILMFDLTLYERMVRDVKTVSPTTIEIEDSNLYVDDKEQLVEGSEGYTTETYDAITYNDGITDEDILDSVVTNPISNVVRKGTLPEGDLHVNADVTSLNDDGTSEITVTADSEHEIVNIEMVGELGLNRTLYRYNLKLNEALRSVDDLRDELYKDEDDLWKVKRKVKKYIFDSTDRYVYEIFTSNSRIAIPYFQQDFHGEYPESVYKYMSNLFTSSRHEANYIRNQGTNRHNRFWIYTNTNEFPNRQSIDDFFSKKPLEILYANEAEYSIEVLPNNFQNILNEIQKHTTKPIKIVGNSVQKEQPSIYNPSEITSINELEFDVPEKLTSISPVSEIRTFVVGNSGSYMVRVTDSSGESKNVSISVDKNGNIVPLTLDISKTNIKEDGTLDIEVEADSGHEIVGIEMVSGPTEGRNLLLNSEFKKPLNTSFDERTWQNRRGAILDIRENGTYSGSNYITTFMPTPDGFNSSDLVLCFRYMNHSFNVNDLLSYSFWTKSNDEFSFYVRSGSTLTTFPRRTDTIKPTNEWQRTTQTSKIEEMSDDYLYNAIVFVPEVSGSFSLSNPKLEKGEPTPYTPAPEDIRLIDDTKTYPVAANGTYTFLVLDSAGRTQQTSIIINNFE